jgi:hypothetical protein
MKANQYNAAADERMMVKAFSVASPGSHNQAAATSD